MDTELSWRHCVVVDSAVSALDPMAALAFVSDPGFGGISLFVGQVRELNHGRPVTGISYDMFDELAVKIFARVAQQARDDFGPQLKVYVAHARGRLAVGGIAVVVAAGTPHRDEAFRACRWLIEAVKHHAPIWKREHFADGDSGWSEGCSLCDVSPTHKHAPVPGHDQYGHDAHRH